MKMNRFSNRALAIVTALLLLFQQIPALAAAEEWNSAASDPIGTEDYVTVRFTADGEEVAALLVRAGAAIGRLPDAPEREGYAFLGWFAGEEPVTEETVVTAATEITASYINEAYPALRADYDNGRIAVRVSAPEGALPKGVSPVMETVSDELVRETVEGVMGHAVGQIAAVNISFLDENGSKIQPEKPVKVQIALTGMQADRVSVVHIPDELLPSPAKSGKKLMSAKRGAAPAAEVVDFSVQGDTLSFDADSFSVYAVLENIEPESRMTVNFYGKDTSTPLATMYIKNSDDLAAATQILFDPGAGTLADGETFRGWVIGNIAHAGETATMPEYDVNTATTEGALKTIQDIRQWAADFSDIGTNNIKEGDVVNIRAAIYKIYVVTYLDSNDIAQSADGILIMPDDTSAYYEYTISQDYTPVKDTVKFDGWNAIDDANITAQTRHDDNLYQKDDVINITGNVDFKVKQSEGHWIVFHENGKGGTYKAPQFVETGKNTVDPGTMERKGYEFGGWYTEVTGDPDDHNYQTVVESSKFTFGDDLDDFGEGKLHLYAKWTPVERAPYTIIFWGQQLDENGKVKPGSYEVLDSFVYNQGIVDDIIPYISRDNGDEDYAYQSGNGNYGAFGRLLDDLPKGSNDPEKGIMGHYRGFNLREDSKNQRITITPEGDAVLNLYYDRVTYNFKFYLYRANGNNYDYANNSGSGSSLSDLVTWHSNQNQHPDVNGYTIQQETVGGRTYYYFTITAAYGESISSKWPTYDKFIGCTYDGPGTNSDYDRQAVSFVMMVGTKLKPNATNQGSGTVKGVISVLNWNILGATNNADGNYVVVRFPNTYYNWRYHIWYETVEGEDYSGKKTYTYNGKTYYEDTVLIVRSSNTTDGNQNEPKYTGFEYVTRMGQNQYGTWGGAHWSYVNGNWGGQDVNNNSSHEYHLNYIYNRQLFYITYFDGNYVDGDGKTIQNRASQRLHESSEMAQGVVIPDEYRNYTPTAQEPGYIFEGWYLDEGCTVKYPWSTMPVGPENHSSAISVYAKWQQIEYRVFLHSGVPNGESFTWGSDDQKMNFRVEYGGKVSLPTGRDREGWEFLGWYTTPNYVPSSRFTSDYQLTESNVTTNYNKETDFTDPMNKWGYITGTGTNSDVNRDWITKKLDLYAKWHQVLEGADGINVVYDPILAGDGVEPPTGSNAPIDGAYYIDTAMATAQAGATADNQDKYQFECWVVQKWNGTAFVDTEVEVYPGDTFEVLKANAKEENLTEIDPNHPNITKKYTVQLRAKYKPVEDPTPTHIWWFPNYPGSQTQDNIPVKNNTVITTGDGRVTDRMAINEAVEIKAATTFPKDGYTVDGYTFIGWSRREVGETHSDTNANNAGDVLNLDKDDLYIKWEDGKYWAKQGSEWVVVTAVAADEAHPYHDMYAVWEPRKFTVTVIKETDSGYLPETYNFDSDEFTFDPTFTGLAETAENKYNTNFNLVGDGTSENHTKVFTEVPYNTSFSIAELAGENDGNARFYKTSYTVMQTTDANGETFATPVQVAASDVQNDAKSYRGTVQGDLTITFTNVRQWGYLKVGKHFDAQNPYLDGVDLETRWRTLTFTLQNTVSGEYIKVKPDPGYPKLGVYDGSLPSTTATPPTFALSSFQRETGSTHEHQYFYYIWLPAGTYKVEEDHNQAENLLPGYTRETAPYASQGTVPSNGGVHGNTTVGVGDSSRINNHYRGYDNNLAYLDVDKAVTGDAPTETTDEKTYTFVVRNDSLSMDGSPVYIGGDRDMGFYTTDVTKANRFTIKRGEDPKLLVDGRIEELNGSAGEKIKVLKGASYTVIELDSTTGTLAAYEDPNIEGYSWTSTVSISAQPMKETGNKATITNDYTRDKGKLTVTKTVAGEDIETFPWPYSFKIKLNDTSEKWLKEASGVFTLTADETEATAWSIAKPSTGATNSITIENVPTGDYLVIEQGTEEGGAAQIPNYTLEVTYAPEGGAVTVAKGATAEATITNTYTLNAVPVTLKKVVNGNMANVNQEFSFTVKLTKSDGTTADEIEGITDNQGYVINPATRNTTFTLKHTDASATTLGEFPIGDKLVITETTGTGAELYKTAYTTTGTAPTFPIETDSKSVAVEVTELEAGKTAIEVICGNYWNIPIETGVTTDSAPYVLAVSAAMMSAAVWMLLRRRAKAAGRED